MGRGIAEGKKVEEELLNDKKFTEVAINAQRDTFFVFEPSTGKAIRWNKAFSDISGYTDEEIANLKAPESYYSELDLISSAKATEKIGNDGTALLEMNLITKDGQSIPFEYLGTNINDQDGDLKYIVSVGRDIRERREAENKLKETERYLSNIFSSIQDGICVLDKDYNIMSFNPKTEEWYSHLKPIIGKKCFQAFCNRIDPCEDCQCRDILKNGDHFCESEIYKEINGKIDQIFDVYTFPLYDQETGNINGIIKYMRDITGKKKAEQKLKESEKRLKDERDNLLNTLNSMEDGVYIINRNHEIEFVNPSLKNGFGPIENKKCYEYFQNLSEPCPWCKTLDKTTHGSIRWEWDSLVTKKYYEIIATPIKNTDNSISKLVIFHDITERKKAEQKLKESEEKFRNLSKEYELILDNFPGLIFSKDTKNNFIHVNRNVVASYNRDLQRKEKFSSKKDLEGRNLFDIIPRDIAQAYWDDDLEVIRSRLSKLNIEESWESEDGTNWISTSKIPFTDENGNVKGVVGISMNITERKKAEQKLKESEEGYRLFLENFQGIAYLTEFMNFTPIFFHGSVEDITGYSSNDFIQRKVLWDKLIHPEDLPRFIEKGKELISDLDKAANIEYRIINKNGDIKWVFDTGKCRFNDSGNLFMQGGVYDITERKQSEQKLKESEERFKDERDNLINMLNSMEDGVYIINQHYEIEFVNPSLTREFGPVEGKKCYEYFQNLSEPCPWCKTQEEIKFGSIRWEWDSPITKKFYEMTATPIKRANNGISKLVIFHDITERKKAEHKLKESEARFSTAFLLNSNLMAISEVEDGTFVEVNDAFLETIKTTREEIIGKSVKILYDDPNVMDYLLAELREKGKVVNYKLNFKTLDGDPLIGLFSFDLVDIDGKPYLISVAKDITAREFVEQKLKESEEKYRALFDNSLIGIGLSTLEGEALDSNDAMEVITGYSIEDLNKIGISSIYVDPNARSEILKLLQEVGKVVDYETKFKKKDKTEFFGSLSLDIIELGGKKIMQSSLIDITERKKAEGKLKDSEEKYRVLFELSPVGIGISDFEGNVHSMNHAMEEITGYDLESQKQTNLRSTYVNPDDRIKLFKKLKETGRIQNYYVKFRKRDGAIYDALLNIDTITIANKSFFITNVQDISERTKVEKKLKELSKLKSELLTRTSHELKTPAMHIKGYADLLLHKYKSNLGIEELQIISHIKKGVLRLETLIYDILHKAELDSGYGELNEVKNDLSSLIDLSVRELTSFAALRGHSLILDIHDSMITIFDKDQIRHVINNLITNAIKYTPLNGIIGINSTIADDYITVAVQDNGIGLTEEQINRLFTQFGKIERYGQGFDIITEGSGLGLYIAQKIIDLHGGRIWVESGGRNKGSTFYFSLPRDNN